MEASRVQRRVLIVDDHPIVRQGLRRMIESESDLVVCGEVQTEREARTAIRAMVSTGQRIRTDLSATLFFSSPEEYDGGELLVEDTYGQAHVLNCWR